MSVRLPPFSQISFEPVLGAYQSLAQVSKVPFSRIFSFFLQFWGFEGEFKPTPNPGAHQTPVETLPILNHYIHVLIVLN